MFNTRSIIFLATFSLIFSFFLYINLIRNGYFGFDVYENYNPAPDAYDTDIKNNEKLHSLTEKDFNTFRERRVVLNSNKTQALPGKVNACILVLIDDEELQGWRPTMRHIEDRFNNKFNYTYVFLSFSPYYEKFTKGVAALTSAKIEFGRIPHKHWKIPGFINIREARKKMKESKTSNVYQGASLKHRFHSRYMSGYFFRHELTKKYDYYWKIDTNSEISCDLFGEDDPFVTMQNSRSSYGFTISTHELPGTIPSLWSTAKNLNLEAKMVEIFLRNSTQKTGEVGYGISFISDDSGKTYNGCHFWPAMEMGDFNMFRNSHYLEYFDKIDVTGGFFYERWGDGPVKTIYLSKFRSLGDVKFLSNIGFYKFPYQHCPINNSSGPVCYCEERKNQDTDAISCNKKFMELSN